LLIKMAVNTIWEDGDVLYAADLNYAINTSISLAGRNALNILDLTAQSSLTAGINGNFERDTYTDSDGYLGTIDTGSTTANFNNPAYSTTETITRAHGQSLGINQGRTDKQGIYITVGGSDLILHSITKNTNDDATKGYLTNSSDVVIASGNFVNNVCVFSTPQTLSASTTYGIAVDNAGVDWTSRRTDAISPYPIASTGFNWVGQINGDNRFIYSVDSIQIVTGNSDGIVQTNAQTIESGFTHFMIVSNEETTGTGSVTYDISFDNGSNYQTGLESFQQYEIEDTGTDLILKQNLNAGASNGTASAYNWGVLLW
jgi:hypothetical protein